MLVVGAAWLVLCLVEWASWDAANFDGCEMISLQCRDGTRWELLVNSFLEVLMMSVWFYFMGNH